MDLLVKISDLREEIKDPKKHIDIDAYPCEILLSCFKPQIQGIIKQVKNLGGKVTFIFQPAYWMTAKEYKIIIPKKKEKGRKRRTN